MKHSKKKILIFAAILLIVCFFAVLLRYFLSQRDIYQPIDMVNNPIFTRRNFIEKVYPRFREFEKQSSFAGQSVKSEAVKGDYFFAYIVHGSGVPIVEATCFRVDSMGRAFKIGLFPDPLDSYYGYSDVDPKSCKGIK